jgi:hypothetical protein
MLHNCTHHTVSAAEVGRTVGAAAEHKVRGKAERHRTGTVEEEEEAVEERMVEDVQIMVQSMPGLWALQTSLGTRMGRQLVYSAGKALAPGWAVKVVVGVVMAPENAVVEERYIEMEESVCSISLGLLVMTHRCLVRSWMQTRNLARQEGTAGQEEEAVALAFQPEEMSELKTSVSASPHVLLWSVFRLLARLQSCVHCVLAHR